MLALALLRPADAATITLNDRLNCNTITLEGVTYHFVYFSRTVHFTNPDHVLTKVISYIVVGQEELLAGDQDCGFGNPPGTSDYQWAKCAAFEYRAQGSAPHVSRDRLWRNPIPPEMGPQIVGQGDKNWNP